jgi:hypothetical protein
MSGVDAVNWPQEDVRRARVLLNPQYLSALAMEAGSLAEHDARERHLKRIAPKCKFLNTAARRGQDRASKR